MITYKAMPTKSGFNVIRREDGADDEVVATFSCKLGSRKSNGYTEDVAEKEAIALVKKLNELEATNIKAHCDRLGVSEELFRYLDAEHHRVTKHQDSTDIAIAELRNATGKAFVTIRGLEDMVTELQNEVSHLRSYANALAVDVEILDQAAGFPIKNASTPVDDDETPF